MPTLAHKHRGAEIRQYFKEHWLHSDDWKAIRSDITSQFSLEGNAWYHFRPILKSMQANQGAARPVAGRNGRKPSGRAAVREYFRRNLAHKVTDADQARQEIIDRFGISKSTWYSLKSILQGIIEETKQRSGNGDLVVPDPIDLVSPGPIEPQPEEQVLEIPADVSPAAKACINLLLAKNHHLASEIQIRDVELAGHRGQIAQGQGRSRLLKRIISELLEAV